MSLVKTAPFFIVHFACLAAFFLKFHWSYLVVCLAVFYVRMFFVAAGYHHRYFSHRSYKTSRVFQFVIALIAGVVHAKGRAVVGRHVESPAPPRSTRTPKRICTRPR